MEDDSDNILTLSHALERDIDLILVEELKCSNYFVSQFILEIEKFLNHKIIFTTSEVLHSKRRTTNSREIDIRLKLNYKSSASYILIENKLDTEEQEGQAESYQDECKTLAAISGVTSAISVLFCPASYQKLNKEFADKFTAVITYECMISILQTLANKTEGELACRLFYRCELLRQAINKTRRGYCPIPCNAVSDFNQSYRALCQQYFPKLIPSKSMRKDVKPGEAKTMIFDSKTLVKANYLPRTRLVHQLRKGNANICLYTWGEHYSKIAPIIEKDIASSGLKIEATRNPRKGGSAGLIIFTVTPPVNNFQSFEAQKKAILDGMERTEALRIWFESNQPIIQRWASIISMGGNHA